MNEEQVSEKKVLGTIAAEPSPPPLDKNPEATAKVLPSIEWDGIVEDIGLSGVIIRPVDEHKLWATKEMFPNKARVHVKVVRQ